MKRATMKEIRETNPFVLMVRHWDQFGYIGYLKGFTEEALPGVLSAIGMLLLVALHVIFFPLLPIISPTVQHIRAKRHYAHTKKLREEYRK